MVWSGLTRLIRSMVQQSGKSIEIPGLGTFGPLVDKFRRFRDPMDKGEEKSAPIDALKPIRFLAHDDFNSACGLVCDANTDKAVRRYNKEDRDSLVEAFDDEFVQQVSWASVSRSCLTDAQTCELVW